MSTLKVLHEITLFDDSDSTNDPDQARIKYKLSQEEDLTSDFRLDMMFSASTTTNTNIPSGSYTWLYVLTDQEINVRMEGVVTNDVNVAPSAAGTKDGLLIKRGTFTSLSINVPGAVDANVFILGGAI